MLFNCSEEYNASLSDTMKVGAFASTKTQPINDTPDLIMPNAPFSKLLCERVPSPVSCPECQTQVQAQSPKNGDHPTVNGSSNNSDNNVMQPDKNGNHSSVSGNSSPNLCRTAEDLQTQGITMTSTNDDFIMVDLVNIYRITSFSLLRTTFLLLCMTFIIS